MRILRLQTRNFRILRAAEIEPAPCINWFHGANGAGKTSILEAIHVLAKGRSFRSGQTQALIGPAGPELQVVARVSGDLPRDYTLGMARTADHWEGRIDGQPAQRVAEFARRIPMVLIEPGSHALIEGGPAHRRQYLDWTLFHVKPNYLEQWRSYARHLRQRNAALRGQHTHTVLESFEAAFMAAAGRVHEARAALVVGLREALVPMNDVLGVRLGELTAHYRPGWPQGAELADVLTTTRQQDRDRGYTTHGPHRAELVLLVDGQPAARTLSRGQQKLLSLLLLLAQHQMIATHQGKNPLLLLDDPISELDDDHYARVWNWVRQRAGQTWVTALAPPAANDASTMAMFHVEQGRIRPHASR